MHLQLVAFWAFFFWRRHSLQCECTISSPTFYFNTEDDNSKVPGFLFLHHLRGSSVSCFNAQRDRYSLLYSNTYMILICGSMLIYYSGVGLNLIHGQNCLVNNESAREPLHFISLLYIRTLIKIDWWKYVCDFIRWPTLNVVQKTMSSQFQFTYYLTLLNNLTHASFHAVFLPIEYSFGKRGQRVFMVNMGNTSSNLT